MAIAAGWNDTPTVRQAFWAFNIEDFARRVTAAERERCLNAALAEIGEGGDNLAYRVAAAIRGA